MPTFTQKYEDFLDNNHPGGYISTSTSISDSDLDARITQNVNNRGFLTSISHLPWNQIDNKPQLFTGDYEDLSNKPTLFSGNYNELINKPTIPEITISNTLNEGTRLATITINGVSTDIYGASGGLNNESDPVFTASPAHNISMADINAWNNKSNFSGSYTNLTDIPSYFPARYVDLLGAPQIPSDAYLDVEETTTPMGFEMIAFTGDYNNLFNTPNYIIHFNELFTDNNIKTLGTSPVCINNSNQKTCIFNEESTNLELLLKQVVDDFIYTHQSIQFANAYFKIPVIQAIRFTETYDQITLGTLIQSNYETLTNTPNVTDNQILSNISLTISHIILIVDYSSHKVFCFIEDV